MKVVMGGGSVVVRWEGEFRVELGLWYVFVIFSLGGFFKVGVVLGFSLGLVGSVSKVVSCMGCFSCELLFGERCL